MKQSSLPITFVPISQVLIDERYWVRLEQEHETRAITPGEVADVIDAVYDFEPCSQEQAGGEEAGLNEQGQPEPPLSKEELKNKLNTVLKLGICEDLASSIIKLRVIRSHIDEPYRLNLSDGNILNTIRKTEEKTVSLAVDGQREVDLEYPPSKLRLSRNLEYTLSGSKIVFDEPVTDIFTANFVTTYDEVEIEVPNDEEGNPGECTALCFYHGLVEERALDIPDPDENEDGLCAAFGLQTSADIPREANCYKLLHRVTKCRCSGMEHSRETEEIAVTCPEGAPAGRQLEGSETITTGYVDCGEETGDISTSEFYEEKCCVKPNRSLPRCSVVKSVYRGGRGIKGGAQKYKDLYGENTRIIGVGPAEGPCGDLVIEHKLMAKNCCEDVIDTPLRVLNDVSIDVLADNSSGIVVLDGGLDEIEWQVYGQDVWLNQSHTLRRAVGGRVARIYAGDTCGMIFVTATDGCTVVQHTLRAETGYWQEIDYWKFSDGGSNLSFPPIQGEGTILSASPSGFTAEIVSREYRVVEQIGTEQFGTHCHPAYGDCCPVAENQAVIYDVVPEFLGLWAFTGSLPEEYWKDTCLDPDMCNATVGDGGDLIPPCNRHCQNCYPGLSIVWTYGGPWYPSAAVLRVRRIYKWVC